MELTLQEIADAAIRDLDARSARRRRPVRPTRGAPRPFPPGPGQVARPLPVKVEVRVRPPRLRPAAVPAAAPARRYLILFTAGLILLGAGGLGLAWAHASTGWQQEARGQRRELILQQGIILHAQIRTLSQQAERLEGKARTLLQYSADLRNSFDAASGASEIEQAEKVLADRVRLLGEIADRRRQIADLRHEAAALHEQP